MGRDYMEKKAIGLFKKLASKLNRPQTSMVVVYSYGCGLFVLFLLVLFTWFFNWWISGHPDIQTLMMFFRDFTAPAVVAAFSFVAVFCVDKNRDGRPDAAEKQAEAEPQTGLKVAGRNKQ